MRSIVLDPGVKDLLLEDARDFLRSKSWYAERGIPFRRGYLLVRIFLLRNYHILKNNTSTERQDPEKPV